MTPPRNRNYTMYIFAISLAHKGDEERTDDRQLLVWHLSTSPDKMVDGPYQSVY